MRTLLLVLGLATIPLIWGIWRTARSGDKRPSTARTVDEPAPDTLELSGASAFDLQAHLQDGHGIPILDFHALGEWAETAEALERGRRAWLLHLRDWMGPQALLTETSNAWVLSSYPAADAAALAEFVGATRQRILKLLSGVAEFPRDQRIILIAFESQEHYYDYVANYYPEEGEFAFSGGMFINAGCPHFVVVRAELTQIEQVVAHEMTHNSLAHLELPLWLDEGIAVNAEHHLASSHRNAHSTLELLAKHHCFWTPAIVQEFWSGESFHRTDEGNELSYDLARAIVELLGRQWESFTRFANAAKREDGGAAAACIELGLDLGELAGAAINMKATADWSPTPGTWTRVSRKAFRPPKAGLACGPSARSAH